MPSVVFLFIYSRVRRTAETVMRFKIENIEHTLKQIQHNEFLIRISKDPLKPNLEVLLSECYLSWNQWCWQMLFDRTTAFLRSAVVASNLHISFANTGHLAMSVAMEYIKKSIKNTDRFLIWKVSKLHHRFTFVLFWDFWQFSVFCDVFRSTM